MIDRLFWVSSLGLLGLAVAGIIRRKDRYALGLAVLAFGGLLLLLISSHIVFLPWEAKITPCGGEAEGTLIFWLYLSMLAGMLAHYGYVSLERPRGRRRKFDLGVFLAPIFVSPIVFLPLASVLEATDPIQANASRLVLFLVSFENGFFWREFFDNRSRARSGEQ
jgi:hypothetical protein